MAIEVLGSGSEQEAQLALDLATTSQTGKAWRSGVESAAGNFKAGVAAGLEAIGDTAVAKELYADAQLNQQAAQLFRPDIMTPTDVATKSTGVADTLGNVLALTRNAILSSAPQMAATVAGGIAGGALAGPVGAAAGAYATALPGAVGDLYKGEGSAADALSLGAISAGLDIVPELGMARRAMETGGTVARQGMRQALKDVGRTALKEGAGEAVTESLQEGLGVAMDVQYGQKISGIDAAKRMLEAGVVGGLAGAGVSVGVSGAKGASNVMRSLANSVSVQKNPQVDAIADSLNEEQATLLESVSRDLFGAPTKPIEYAPEDVAPATGLGAFTGSMLRTAQDQKRVVEMDDIYNAYFENRKTELGALQESGFYKREYAIDPQLPLDLGQFMLPGVGGLLPPPTIQTDLLGDQLRTDVIDTNATPLSVGFARQFFEQKQAEAQQAGVPFKASNYIDEYESAYTQFLRDYEAGAASPAVELAPTEQELVSELADFSNAYRKQKPNATPEEIVSVYQGYLRKRLEGGTPALERRMRNRRQMSLMLGRADDNVSVPVAALTDKAGPDYDAMVFGTPDENAAIFERVIGSKMGKYTRDIARSFKSGDSMQTVLDYIKDTALPGLNPESKSTQRTYKDLKKFVDTVEASRALRSSINTIKPTLSQGEKADMAASLAASPAPDLTSEIIAGIPGGSPTPQPVTRERTNLGVAKQVTTEPLPAMTETVDMFGGAPTPSTLPNDVSELAPASEAALDAGMPVAAPLSKALRRIADVSGNPLYKLLAAKLVPLTQGYRIAVVQRESDVAALKLDKDAADMLTNKRVYGFESPAQSLIVINGLIDWKGTNVAVDDVLMHESIHAATSTMLDFYETPLGRNDARAAALVDALNDVRSQIRSQHGTNERVLAATVNNKELIAWALTSRPFADLMRNTQVKKPTSLVRTVWDAFTTALRNLFGVSDQQSDAFSVLLSLTGEVFDLVDTRMLHGMAVVNENEFGTDWDGVATLMSDVIGSRNGARFDSAKAEIDSRFGTDYTNPDEYVTFFANLRGESPKEFVGFVRGVRESNAKSQLAAIAESAKGNVNYMKVVSGAKALSDAQSKPADVIGAFGNIVSGLAGVVRDRIPKSATGAASRLVSAMTENTIVELFAPKFSELTKYLELRNLQDASVSHAMADADQVTSVWARQSSNDMLELHRVMKDATEANVIVDKSWEDNKHLAHLVEGSEDYEYAYGVWQRCHTQFKNWQRTKPELAKTYVGARKLLQGSYRKTRDYHMDIVARSYDFTSRADMQAELDAFNQWLAKKTPKTDAGKFDLRAHEKAKNLRIDEMSRKYGYSDYAALRQALEQFKANPNDYTSSQADAFAAIKAELRTIRRGFRAMKPRDVFNLTEDEKQYLAQMERVKAAVRSVQSAFRELQGDYFPLRRNGNYVVMYEAADDQSDNGVEFHESEAAADARVRELEGMGYRVGRDYKSDRKYTSSSFVPAVVRELVNSINESTMTEEEKADFIDTVYKSYIRASNDQSVAVKLKRRNVAGASEDMLRAVTGYVAASAVQHSKLEFDHQIYAQLRDADMKYGSRRNSKGELVGTGSYEWGRIRNEMTRRMADYASDPSPFLQKLGAVGYSFYLSANPAFVASNLMQPWIVGVPYLGATYGFKKAVPALMSSTRRAGAILRQVVSLTTKDAAGFVDKIKAMSDPQAAFDPKNFDALKSVGISGDLANVIIELTKMGKLSFTQTSDIMGYAEGTKAADKISTMSRAASLMAHYSEMQNRLATIIAAYELAKEKDPTIGHEDLVARIVKVNDKVNLDYTRRNKATIFNTNGMFGKVTPLVFQFQSFGFQMLENTLMLTWNAFKASDVQTRSEARRAILGMGFTTAAFAGVLGMPMFTAFAAVANTLLGDEEEPYDIRVELRDFLYDTMGQTASDVLSKGLLTLIGLDMQNRVGLADLVPFSKMIADNRRIKEYLQDEWMRMSGPSVEMLASWADAAQYATDGEFIKAMEAGLPVAARNVIKGLKTGDAGYYMGYDGTPIPLNASFGDALWVGAGFSTIERSSYMDGKAYARTLEAAVSARKQALRNQALQARLDNDQEAYAAALANIQEWNRLNPDYRLTEREISRAERKFNTVLERGIIETIPERHKDVIESLSFAIR